MKKIFYLITILLVIVTSFFIILKEDNKQAGKYYLFNLEKNYQKIKIKDFYSIEIKDEDFKFINDISNKNDISLVISDYSKKENSLLVLINDQKIKKVMDRFNIKQAELPIRNYGDSPNFKDILNNHKVKYDIITNYKNYDSFILNGEFLVNFNNQKDFENFKKELMFHFKINENNLTFSESGVYDFGGIIKISLYGIITLLLIGYILILIEKTTKNFRKSSIYYLNGFSKKRIVYNIIKFDIFIVFFTSVIISVYSYLFLNYFDFYKLLIKDIFISLILIILSFLIFEKIFTRKNIASLIKKQTDFFEISKINLFVQIAVIFFIALGTSFFYNAKKETTEQLKNTNVDLFKVGAITKYHINMNDYKTIDFYNGIIKNEYLKDKIFYCDLGNYEGINNKENFEPGYKFDDLYGNVDVNYLKMIDLKVYNDKK